jgi:S-adenosylmethionine:tRNA ribosyltransferase-isomerase
VKTKAFSYDLPRELIAQKPLSIRHDSRLMVYDKRVKKITHSKFLDIVNFLREGDLLVVNRTKVIPARLYGKKQSGGKVEILLLEKINENSWEVLVGGKNLTEGRRITFPNGLKAVVEEVLNRGKRVIKFDQPIEPYLDEIGNVPLPPYIHEKLADPERYQTIFAKSSGSAAAPTAGLHFSEELIKKIEDNGVGFQEITLHVGLDTFAPVTEENIENHHIHTEWCEITKEAADRINRVIKNGGRIIAVGTTSVRTLETAASKGKISPFSGSTRLFIYPGYDFQIIDGMITNFHLPKSSLLMLVSAFMGLDEIMRCYEAAKEEKYRFYSFGDAMLIL